MYPATSREKEIAQILSFVKEGKSCQLIGAPGVGRANLLGLLTYNRDVREFHLGEAGQLDYHFVLCNFSEIKNRPLFDVMKFLFLELSSSLHERGRKEDFRVVDKLFKDALSYGDELVLFQELKQAIDYLSLEKKLTIVFLLERFETYIPKAVDDFFNNLRSIRNRVKYKFCVVFSTIRPLEDMLDPDILADFYEFVVGNDVYMALDDSPGLAFRIRYLEKLTKKKLSPKTTMSIVKLTAGHGKLTRLALEAAFAKDMWKKELTEDFLLEQKTIQSALLEIWHFFTPDEQQDMFHLCIDEPCPTPNPFLAEIGLIRNGGIAIPLLKTFVARQKHTEPTKVAFHYDSATQTILRGNVVISDTLTLSEFRLLRLLLEKEDTVIDREALVGAVWSDTKTQEGVSEQALDQLILRLRKKIEDDPTHPTHIQTVKGRGLKFVA